VFLPFLPFLPWHRASCSGPQTGTSSTWPAACAGSGSPRRRTRRPTSSRWSTPPAGTPPIRVSCCATRGASTAWYSAGGSRPTSASRATNSGRATRSRSTPQPRTSTSTRPARRHARSGSWCGYG
jgi:hypothetical protein